MRKKTVSLWIVYWRAEATWKKKEKKIDHFKKRILIWCSVIYLSISLLHISWWYYNVSNSNFFLSGPKSNLKIILHWQKRHFNIFNVWSPLQISCSTIFAWLASLYTRVLFILFDFNLFSFLKLKNKYWFVLSLVLSFSVFFVQFYSLCVLNCVNYDDRLFILFFFSPLSPRVDMCHICDTLPASSHVYKGKNKILKIK